MNQDVNANPTTVVQLPTIASIHQAQSSNSTTLLPSNPSNMILNSTSNLPQPDPPYLALTAQQRDLQKLLMASIKRKVNNKPEDVDVREAFGLKRITITKTPPAPAPAIAKPTPYSKAAEEAIIAGAIKSEKAVSNDGPSLGTYKIPTPQNPPPPSSKSSKPSNESKPAKEKSKSKPKPAKKETKEEPKPVPKEKPKEKPKDKEELARLSKEKEEKNALRLKQLNTELLAWKHRSFFLQEAKPVQLLRKRCFRDSLLQEVQWMAIDFRQERRWKLAMQQTLSASCVEHVKERLLSLYHRSEEEMRPLKAICQALCGRVERFWGRFRPQSFPSVESMRAGAQDTQRFLYEVIDEALPSVVERLHARRPVFDLDAPLPPKHADALQRVGLINSIGYGAILSGTPHGGKTTVSARLLREWYRQAATSEEATCGRFSVVVVPWYAVSLWQYKLHSLGLVVELWHFYSSKPPSETQVVLLSNKDIISFISYLRSFDKSPLIGVIIDCRDLVVELVKSTSNDEVIKGTKKSEESYAWMRLFFSTISSDLANRCIIVDDLESCGADRNLLLAALIPYFHLYKHSPTPHRRCLDFMERLKVNLSVEVSKVHEFHKNKTFLLIF